MIFNLLKYHCLTKTVRATFVSVFLALSIIGIGMAESVDSTVSVGCVYGFGFDKNQTFQPSEVSDSILFDPNAALVRCVATEHSSQIHSLVEEVVSRSTELTAEAYAQLLQNWTGILYRRSLDSAAYMCVNELFELSDKSDIQNLKSKAFQLLAFIANYRNERYSAMPLLDSALAHLERGSHELEARILMDYGRMHYDVGDYGAAMKYYSRSREIFEEHEIINPDLGGLMHYIGSVFKRQYEDSIAGTYYEKMIEIGDKHNMPLVKAEGLYLLADIYGFAGDVDMELSCTMRAYKIYEEAGDEDGIVQCLLAIGRAHYYAEEDDLAVEYCKKALDRNDGRSSTIAFNGHRYIGRIYARNGRFREAHEYFDMAAEIAKSTEEKRWINLKNLYYTIAQAYVKEGDWESAFVSLEKYLNYQDTLVKKENRNVVFELEQRYEKEKKEAEIMYLNKDSELQRSRVQRQRNALIASSLGILLIIVLAISIYSGKKRAERAEQHKEQFLANMSHEIRTPMHAVSGMTKILIRNEPREDQRKYLNAISESASNLLVILNDILDLSKVADGKLTIERIPLDMRKIIETVLGMLNEKASERNVTTSFEVDEKIPAQIFGDPTRLTQILLNLVGNAIKFTEDGSVKVVAKVDQDDMVVSVIDTGIGIPKNKLQRVFSSFEQVDLSTTRKYGGTGLGLSITKKLIELQGGRIWVESELGVGSTFSLALPLEATEVENVTVDLSSEEVLKLKGQEIGEVKILLAEDDDFNVMVATDDLAYYLPSAQVELARNGQEAIEMWQLGEFDIILMDIHMPELNGLDASERIRKLEAEKEGKRVPIVAMTASLLKSELDRCYNAGMDAYIPKPYALEDLVGTIHGQLVVN